MQLFRNNQNTEVSQTGLEVTEIQIANYPTTFRPQLTMVWVEEIQDGKPMLIAKWIAL